MLFYRERITITCAVFYGSISEQKSITKDLLYILFVIGATLDFFSFISETKAINKMMVKLNLHTLIFDIFIFIHFTINTL